MVDNRNCNGVKLVKHYMDAVARANNGIKTLSSESLRRWAADNNHPLEAKETKDGTILVRMDSNKPWDKLEDWVGNYRQRCRSQAVMECSRLKEILTPQEYRDFLAHLTSEFRVKAPSGERSQALASAPATPPPISTKPPQVEIQATKPPVKAPPKTERPYVDPYKEALRRNGLDSF